MFGLGLQELLVILVIALLVVGPKRLPEIARTLGRSFAEFRRTSDEIRASLDVDFREEESHPQRTQSRKEDLAPSGLKQIPAQEEDEKKNEGEDPSPR
ncbi:MAG: twin-arginine translocase subunit TatB [Candidatus Tectomicrobia bacterium]|uniref:Twin-arginine translocase subunit TatB n=1 Tax=Tectimicrobiota bacterium TaxID=2528274 RepID=A0A932G243_UNCTE|nr:twin-arginine translocase subunit TatB [Candidatus Tectomicrobia bacterium]